MTDGRVLATINDIPRMRRMWHRLDIEKRRKVLFELNGQLDENLFKKTIRRIKRISQKENL